MESNEMLLQKDLTGIDPASLAPYERQQYDAIKKLQDDAKAQQGLNPADPKPTDPPAEPGKTDPPAAPVEGKSLFDILNEDKPAETAAPVVELPKEVQDKLTEYETWQAQQKTISESPIYKLLNSGLSLEQIREKLKTQDFSGVTIENLVKDKIQKTFSLTEGEKFTELYDAQMAAYENMPPLQKAEFEQSLRESFKKANTSESGWPEIEQAFDELKKNREGQPNQEQVKQQIEAQKQQIISSDMNAIDGLLKKALDAKAGIDGVMLDEKTASEIKADYRFELAEALYLKDGKDFNAAQFIKDRFTLRKHDDLLVAAEKRGFEKARKEFTNPDTNTGGGSGGSQQVTGAQIAESAMQTRLRQS